MKGLDIPSAKIHKLEAEIKDGKCIVQLGHDNSLERVVAVEALHIENNDGHIFVQVGKFDAAGGVSVTCVLPGKKRGKGEFPHETIERVIENDLAPLSRSVKITRTEREIEIKASPTYGLDTKYLRTVHYARLRTDAPLPQLEELGTKAGPDVPKHTVHMIRSNNSAILYSWLTPEIFDLYRTPTGRRCCRLSLTGLRFRLSSDKHKKYVCTYTVYGYKCSRLLLALIMHRVIFLCSRVCTRHNCTEDSLGIRVA